MDSEHRDIRKLLNKMKLDNKKPSQLLQQMKQANEQRLPDDEVRTLWLQSLPTQIQTIFTTNTKGADELAPVADKMVQIFKFFICAVSAPASSSTERTYRNLQRQILILIERVGRFLEVQGRAWVKRSSTKQRSNGQLHNPCNCWYHDTLGKEDEKASSSPSCVRAPEELDTPDSQEQPHIAGHRSYNCMSINDRTSGVQYLVDTGADKSVIPVPKNSKLQATDYVLYAANGSKIPTYGFEMRSLNFGSERNYKWYFTVAGVTQPLLGADFLRHYNMIVDLCHHRLLFGATQPRTPTKHTSALPVPIVTITKGRDKYQQMLREFVGTATLAGQVEGKHEVSEYIKT